jgi:uncharacterized SAM-binding protein YcdF (DUF218 family)
MSFPLRKESLLELEKNIIIILGCRPLNCVPTVELDGRAKVAFDFYKESKVKSVIVCSGGFTEKDCKHSESTLIMSSLLNLGIDQSDILLESNSTSTIGNAFFTKRLLKERNIAFNKITLVTSCYHEKRSNFIFSKIFQGIEVNYTHCFDYKSKNINESQKMERDSNILTLLEGLDDEIIMEKYMEYL